MLTTDEYAGAEYQNDAPRHTHTLPPDEFIAIRYGQIEDIRDMLTQVMACYTRTMSISEPDGSADSI